MTSVLSLNGLSVQFGGLAAISDVSMEVAEGEILGIIGPNGAGKSTLFNAISGLIRPASGSIAYRGKDITAMAPPRRVALGIQRTFQSVQLVKSMSVAENILLGAHRYISCNPLRRTVARALDRSRDLADFVGVGPFADRVVASLSFREQRLTEIARALASTPTVLLLDEPAAGLSEAEIRDLNALVKRLRDDLKVTVLLVEHVMSLVMDLCDRVAVLENGRLIALAPPPEIAQNEKVIEAYLGASLA